MDYFLSRMTYALLDEPNGGYARLVQEVNLQRATTHW